MERFIIPARARHHAVLAILGLLLAARHVPAADPDEPGSRDMLLLYSFRGILDGEAARKIRDDIDAEIRKRPDLHTIFFEFDSPGTAKGSLAPAEDTARYLGGLKGVHVVVRIPQDGAAGNASALVALAVRDVLMGPGTRLGFLPDPPDGKTRLEVLDDAAKAAEEARKLFKEFAGTRPGPIGKSHLAAALISGHHPAIYAVNFDRPAGKNVEAEVQFLTQDEIDRLDPADRARKRGEMPAVPARQKLTIDRKKAVEYGFALAVESDDWQEAASRLHLAIPPENVVDFQTGGIMKPNAPAVQGLVDFLNHPVVRFILILVGTLGFLLEIKMPGTLVPSLVSLGCFAVFFIAGLFQPTGGVATTSVWEVLLFVIGMGLIAVELLLLPGVLVFGLSGAAACLIAIVLAMVPPSGTTLDYRHALTTLIVSSGTSAFVFFLILKYLPRTRLLDRSGIVIYSSIQGTPTADTAIEAQARAAGLVGKVGTAITPLRPAGTAEVDGQRVDVVAEGDFVEKGEKIQIMELDGTRTLVRKV